MSYDSYDYLFKIILIGDSGVGKTNILSRFTKNTFDFDMKSTIGVEFANRNVTINNKIIKLQIWDTAGQERFRAISGAFYRGALGVLLVYDITKYETFNSCENWFREVKEYLGDKIPVILVGNKNDLKHLRSVPEVASIDYAKHNNMSFLETSAFNNSNIQEAFNILVNHIFHTSTQAKVNNNDLIQNNYIKNNNLPITIDDAINKEKSDSQIKCCK